MVYGFGEMIRLEAMPCVFFFFFGFFCFFVIFFSITPFCLFPFLPIGTTARFSWLDVCRDG